MANIWYSELFTVLIEGSCYRASTVRCILHSVGFFWELPSTTNPSRVKARRGLELLCLIEDDTLDWYDFDEVNTEGLVIPPELRAKHGTPVLEDNDPIWENIE